MNAFLNDCCAVLLNPAQKSQQSGSISGVLACMRNLQSGCVWEMYHFGLWTLRIAKDILISVLDLFWSI